MLTKNKNPFIGHTPENYGDERKQALTLQSNIVDPKVKPIQSFLSDVSDEMVDFINELLIKNPEERLGCRKGQNGKVSRVFSHSIFTKNNFNTLIPFIYQKRVKAPFMPNVKTIEDMCNQRLTYSQWIFNFTLSDRKCNFLTGNGIF